MGELHDKRHADTIVRSVCVYLGYHHYISQARALLMEMWCLTIVKDNLSEVPKTLLALGLYFGCWHLQAIFHALPSRSTASSLAAHAQGIFIPLYWIRASISENTQITWQPSSDLVSKENTLEENVQRSGEYAFQDDQRLATLYSDCRNKENGEVRF